MNFDADFQSLVRVVDLAIILAIICRILKHAPKSYAQNDGSDQAW